LCVGDTDFPTGCLVKNLLVTNPCVQMMYIQDGEEGSEQTDEMLGVLTTGMAAYLRRVLPYFSRKKVCAC